MEKQAGRAGVKKNFADKDNANNCSIAELEKSNSNGMESGGVKNAHFYKAGAFNASNLSCLFFTAAVRVGYAPEIIWKEMRDMILNRGIPNGFLKENPHGIEQLNTIPDAIQEMMLQSCEGMIRIFPVWPRKKHPNAFFRNFRAWGGFEVSAAFWDDGDRKGCTQPQRDTHAREKPIARKICERFPMNTEDQTVTVLKYRLYKEEHAELFRI